MVRQAPAELTNVDLIKAKVRSLLHTTPRDKEFGYDLLRHIREESGIGFDDLSWLVVAREDAGARQAHLVVVMRLTEPAPESFGADVMARRVRELVHDAIVESPELRGVTEVTVYTPPFELPSDAEAVYRTGGCEALANYLARP